jgi:hypothetical protein
MSGLGQRSPVAGVRRRRSRGRRLTAPRLPRAARRHAQAISGPLAAGLLALEGRVGQLRGWQILFLFEGLPAVILGVAIWCVTRVPLGPVGAMLLPALRATRCSAPLM